jgi:hypothetical protein
MGVGILTVLHFRNAAGIAAAISNTAPSLVNDAVTAAHGHWVAALPDVLTQLSTLVQTMAPGDVKAVNTPAGLQAIHMASNGVVSALTASTLQHMVSTGSSTRQQTTINNPVFAQSAQDQGVIQPSQGGVPQAGPLRFPTTLRNAAG